MYRSWCAHRGGALAAELLLFSVLSALPLLLTLAALLGSLESVVGVATAGQVQSWTIEQTQKVVGEGSPVVGVVQGLFRSSARGTLTAGVLVALYSASRAGISLVGSLDVVYGVEGRRNWASRRLAGVVLTLSGLLALPVVLTVLYGGGRFVRRVVADGAAQSALGWGVGVLGYGVFVAVVTGVLTWVPRRRSSLREQLPGAVCTVALVTMWTHVFRWYAGSSHANAVFGVIGAFIGVLWWGYFCACSLFLGAEINEWRRGKRAGGLPSGSSMENQEP